MNSEGLVKIRIPLSAEARGSGYEDELVWAKPSGPDLFELFSIPFFEYNLNLHDLVRCDVAHSPPVVLTRIRPSGNETLRVVFSPVADPELISDCISGLRAQGAIAEPAAQGRLFALSFPSWDALKKGADDLDGAAAADFVSYESGFRRASSPPT